VLQEQYLFPPGQLPTPVFAPQTYWALLMLAEARQTPALWPHLRALLRPSVLRSAGRIAGHAEGIGRALRGRVPRSLWTWLPTARGRRVRAAEHLARYAAAHARATQQWAGFWDQYVIAEAALHWHSGRPLLRSDAWRTLATLPFVQDTIWRVSSNGLDARMAGTSAQTSPESSPALSSLARPGWDDEQPAWLASQYDPRGRIGG